MRVRRRPALQLVRPEPPSCALRPCGGAVIGSWLPTRSSPNRADILVLLGVSGVLAVVTCGLVLGWRAPEIASPESRMQGLALWSILTLRIAA